MPIFTIDLLSGRVFLFSGNFTGSGSTNTYPEVDVYANLPPASGESGSINVVRTSTGIYVLDRKEAGLYYSNGVTWERLGDIPSFFLSNNFQIIDSADTTKGFEFETSGLTTSNLRKVKIQDSDGTVAYLSDIEGKLDVSIFTGYTANTNIRITNIENDIIYISGVTDTKLNISDFNSYTGTTDTRISDIEDDITYISGVTDTKQDQLSAGVGINSSKLTNDIVELDLTAYTPIGGVNITLTGSTNAVINDLRTLAKGFEYGGDYSANFTVRSLVDKGYVDAVAIGLDLKESVRAATTSGQTDIDLTGGTFVGTIDGHTPLDGDRILVKNQDSAKEENGIWVYSSGGNTFGRAIDFVNPHVTSGAFTFVETGNTNSGSGWVLITQDPIDIGVTPLTFTQFSEAGVLTAGVGIDITNGVISFDGASVAGDSITWSGTQLNIDISTGNTLGNALATKLNISDFNIYSGTTDTRITNIENDITYISGITDTKLDTNIFTGYTASTVSNEIYLLHTGGTDVNTITPTSIIWNSGVTIGSAYTFTGGTNIQIEETGEYEIIYNIPYTQTVGGQNKAIGGNLLLNTLTVNESSAAGFTSVIGEAGSVGLPTINLSLIANDILNLVCFRTGGAGTALTSPNGSILIKKKGRLQ